MTINRATRRTDFPPGPFSRLSDEKKKAAGMSARRSQNIFQETPRATSRPAIIHAERFVS